jgi:hypothetical protein
VSNSFTISRTGVQADCTLDCDTDIPDMTLLDVFVDANFRREQVGQVVVFPWGPRNRGYIVKSEREELRIKSFLRMFYFAQLSIQSLGLFLALEWSRDLSYALGRPSAFLFRVVITLSCYSLVVAIPYLLLWRSYRRSLPSFVCDQDQVPMTSRGRNRSWILRATVLAISLLVLLSVILLIHGVSVAR